MVNCAVVDLGAGSGRVMLARYDDGRLRLEEMHRFHGYAVERSDGPHWDLARILAEVEEGLRKASAAAGRLDSIGVDGWGLDYALLDAAGRFLGEPYHYRHPRSQRGYETCPVPAETLFERTGSQILPINTVYQLSDEVTTAPGRLAGASRLLMMADAVCYHLTGVARAELTLARTTGMMDAAGDTWRTDVSDRIGVDATLLAPLIAPGQTWARLRSRFGLGSAPVIAVAAHDTASAVAALSLTPDRGFLILGSWSLLGAETPRIDVRPEVRQAGFGNEGGIAGRSYLVRSLNGLQLIQKLRESLRRRGHDLSFAEIARLAAAAPDGPAIDPSDPAFFNPPDVIEAIAATAGQRAAEDPGASARAIYQGLAAETGAAVAALDRLLGHPLTEIRACGGGTLDDLLCRLVAARAGRPLVVGPVEASAAGNAAMQLVGLGQIASIEEARRVIAGSFPTRRIEGGPFRAGH